MFDCFQNSIYVSNYLHLKTFAWKRDCPIFSKVQASRIWPRSFKKALIELHKLNPNGKAVEYCPTFDTQIDITLAISGEKLQNYTF